jgi:NADH:ubiquinone oxidoreductase subunit 6 (subunit J)
LRIADRHTATDGELFLFQGSAIRNPQSAMSLALLIIAFLTLASAAVAMVLRNLIHSALLLIGSWAGIAAFFLWADAQFVAFAQVLVYVGAVSMIVLFAVLLTRRSRADLQLAPISLGRLLYWMIPGAAVFGVLAGAVVSTPTRGGTPPVPAFSVHDIGTHLAGPYAAALLIVGALLTVALLGAVVVAATDRRDETEEAP